MAAREVGVQVLRAGWCDAARPPDRGPPACCQFLYVLALACCLCTRLCFFCTCMWTAAAACLTWVLVFCCGSDDCDIRATVARPSIASAHRAVCLWKRRHQPRGHEDAGDAIRYAVRDHASANASGLMPPPVLLCEGFVHRASALTWSSLTAGFEVSFASTRYVRPQDVLKAADVDGLPGDLYARL